MIARNATKYVGDSVELRCTIAYIVDESSFNADCGTKGSPALLFVDYDDTVSLDRGQPIQILGVVEEPASNAGVSGKRETRPAIKADFIE